MVPEVLLAARDVPLTSKPLPDVTLTLFNAVADVPLSDTAPTAERLTSPAVDETEPLATRSDPLSDVTATSLPAATDPCVKSRLTSLNPPRVTPPEAPMPAPDGVMSSLPPLVTLIFPPDANNSPWLKLMSCAAVRLMSPELVSTVVSL